MEGTTARGILGRCTGYAARSEQGCVARVAIALPHASRNAVHARQGLCILSLSLLCARAVNHFLLTAVNRRSSKPRFKGTQCTQAQRCLPGLRVNTVAFVLVLNQPKRSGGKWCSGRPSQLSESQKYNWNLGRPTPPDPLPSRRRDCLFVEPTVVHCLSFWC